MKKEHYTSISIFLILVIAVGISFFKYSNDRIIVTTYDAFGYYMYLPSAFIYKDFKELNWKDGIEKKYKVFGGEFYQAVSKDEYYVNKYYCGISMLQSPFFLIAHFYSKMTKFESDGFSLPYQIAILLASILYFIFGLLLLRVVLSEYFDEMISAFALIGITIPTNILQYVSVDCGQSHSFLFFVYCLIIYSTHKWHKSPTKFQAGLLGFSIGLAICCRPTEAVSIFIPLLWKFNDERLNKWQFIKSNKNHLSLALLFGFIALLPQFLYWLYATGSFIHDVGSKWQFLNPFFRVLFGGEKGWFIYTPVTIILIFSIFKSQNESYSTSLKFFAILNIWIIISWFDWRYGGSYSTRALSHSLPIFVLPLAGLIRSISLKRLKYALFLLFFYLSITNLFQIYQYNRTIIHFDDMNYKYYSKIYWNINPDCLTFSLLDTKDWIEKHEIKDTIFLDELKEKSFARIEDKELSTVNDLKFSDSKFLKTNISMLIEKGIWGGYIKADIFQNGQIIKEQKIRLEHPNAKENIINCYSFFTDVPPNCENCSFVIKLDQNDIVKIKSYSIQIETLE